MQLPQVLVPQAAVVVASRAVAVVQLAKSLRYLLWRMGRRRSLSADEGEKEDMLAADETDSEVHG